MGGPGSGRKPKPTNQLKREGNYNVTRHRDRVDQRYKEAPLPIHGLGRDGRFAYEMITSSTPEDILCKIDSLALFGLCKWWAEYRKWERKAAKSGDLAHNRMAIDAWKQFVNLARDYGLTPTSRAKVRSNTGAKVKDEADPLAQMIRLRGA